MRQLYVIVPEDAVDTEPENKMRQAAALDTLGAYFALVPPSQRILAASLDAAGRAENRKPSDREWRNAGNLHLPVVDAPMARRFSHRRAALRAIVTRLGTARIDRSVYRGVR